MMGLNAIFHLASAVFLAGLVYYMVRQQQQLQLVQRLWRDAYLAEERRVFVGDAIRFLQTSCAGLGLEFESGETSRRPPQKIHTSEFFRLLSQLRVERIAVVGQDSDRLKIQVSCANSMSPATAADAMKLLDEAFGHKLKFLPAGDEGHS